MSFLALIKYTVKEALAKKILLTIFIIISAIILLFLIAINLDSAEGIFLALQVGEGAEFKKAIIEFENLMISQFPFFMVMTLLIIMVSSFIPAMLEKGNIDLLLSKPITRANIILAKFSAGVIIVFVMLTYLIFLIWFLISVKTGVWYFPFLMSIFWYTLIFAVLYSAVILSGILTNSTILSLLINILIFFPVTSLLSVRTGIYKTVNNKGIEAVVDFFYYILPKPWDIRSISSGIIDGSFSTTGGFMYAFQPVITSIIFMVAALSLSIYFFGKKDY